MNCKYEYLYIYIYIFVYTLYHNITYVISDLPKYWDFSNLCQPAKVAGHIIDRIDQAFASGPVHSCPVLSASEWPHRHSLAPSSANRICSSCQPSSQWGLKTRSWKWVCPEDWLVQTCSNAHFRTNGYHKTWAHTSMHPHPQAKGRKNCFSTLWVKTLSGWKTLKYVYVSMCVYIYDIYIYTHTHTYIIIYIYT